MPKGSSRLFKGHAGLKRRRDPPTSPAEVGGAAGASPRHYHKARIDHARRGRPPERPRRLSITTQRGRPSQETPAGPAGLVSLSLCLDVCPNGCLSACLSAEVFTRLTVATSSLFQFIYISTGYESLFLCYVAYVCLSVSISLSPFPLHSHIYFPPPTPSFSFALSLPLLLFSIPVPSLSLSPSSSRSPSSPRVLSLPTEAARA